MSVSTCVRCGRPAGGSKRAAIWEEEEKGRLGARPLALCDACHAAFLAGELTRVELARAYHAAKHYAPHGWIARLDRDRLLDVACLNCGVLLPLEPEDVLRTAKAAPAAMRCPSCGHENRFARRGPTWLTAEVAA